jgi:outer membrane protein TolC
MKYPVRLACALLILLLGHFESVRGQQNDLQYYIDISLKSSPLIKDIQNQLADNSYDSLLFRANAKPQVSFSTLGYYAPVIDQYGYDYIITNGQQYDALVGVSWQPMWGKNAKAHAQSFAIKAQSLANSKKLTEAELKKAVTTQFITAFGDWLQIQFAGELHHVLAGENDALKEYTEKGYYKQTDYLNFLITYQQLDLQIQQLESQYRYNIQTLNYICGINDTSTVMLTDPGLKPAENSYLVNSIFYKQFELDSLKYLNDRKLVDYNYLPKFSIGSDAGYNTSFAVTPYKNFGASAGFNLSVPIYDGKQRSLRQKQIQLYDLTRTGYRDFFVRQHTAQYNQLQQQLTDLDKLIATANAQLSYSQGLVDSYKKIISTGDVHIADYIIALNNYLQLKNNIIMNTISRYQIINQLNYLNQ